MINPSELELHAAEMESGRGRDETRKAGVSGPLLPGSASPCDVGLAAQPRLRCDLPLGVRLPPTANTDFARRSFVSCR
jgi:hypothetical protein